MIPDDPAKSTTGRWNILVIIHFYIPDGRPSLFDKIMTFSSKLLAFSINLDQNIDFLGAISISGQNFDFNQNFKP